MHGKAFAVKIQEKLRKNGKIVLVFCTVHDIIIIEVVLWYEFLF